MDQQQSRMEERLLLRDHTTADKKIGRRACWVLVAVIAFTGLVVLYGSAHWGLKEEKYEQRRETNDVVESEHGIVATDDGRCSDIGVSVLRDGGHAVDAAVATALCLGVVYPMASGIGGGGFMVVRSSSTSQAEAFDMRETAPLAASKDMFEKNPKAKYMGALSVGVPGEIAGLHETWSRYGRLAWEALFQPAIRLARDGFVVSKYLGLAIEKTEKLIMADPGLRKVFAPKGHILRAGDTCYNIELGHTLEAIAEHGPQVLYNGTIGENFVRDLKQVGGILTMEDLRHYKVEITDAMVVNTMGYTILGMPPPSSGTPGLALVLNILDSYGSSEAVRGLLGLHRLIEAMKHMLSLRMNLGDPDFVNVTDYITDMLSSSLAKGLQKKIFDNTTFPPDYYMNKYSQLRDHGTSHFCIVDSERNAVSMTTTVNDYFGAGILSPSTGIVINNEMDDFSTPTKITVDKLPPAPANFVEPRKRPLSSMTPIIILKDNQLAGVIGGSGGHFIIPAVIQVFLNHFVLGMEPVAAIEYPRVYHELVPNQVLYENWTIIDGEHIELSDERKVFLKERKHELKAQAYGAICQLVVQSFAKPLKYTTRKSTERHSDNGQVFNGILTAVSDPRKDGRPAGL